MIPDWLDKETWEDYKAMRKLIKKPMTPRAEELAIKKLNSFINQGYNSTEVLEQSIFNSWQGLFAPKGESNGQKVYGKAVSRRDSAREAIEALTGAAKDDTGVPTAPTQLRVIK